MRDRREDGLFDPPDGIRTFSRIFIITASRIGAHRATRIYNATSAGLPSLLSLQGSQFFIANSAPLSDLPLAVTLLVRADVVLLGLVLVRLAEQATGTYRFRLASFVMHPTRSCPAPNAAAMRSGEAAFGAPREVRTPGEGRRRLLAGDHRVRAALELAQ